MRHWTKETLNNLLKLELKKKKKNNNNNKTKHIEEAHVQIAHGQFCPSMRFFPPSSLHF